MSTRCPFHSTEATANPENVDSELPLPPELPGGWPWLGHAFAFARDPVDLIRSGRECFGEVFRFKLTGRDVHALIGPAANAAFFRAPDDQLSAREAYRFTVPSSAGHRLRRERGAWTRRSDFFYRRCATTGCTPAPSHVGGGGAYFSAVWAIERRGRSPADHERADGLHRQPVPGRRRVPQRGHQSSHGSITTSRGA